MKKLIVAVLVACCGVQISTQQNQQLSSSTYDSTSCINQDIIYEYRFSDYRFTLQLFKSVAYRSNLNYVFSPNSIWIMLAAMAEGADPLTQHKLFQLLSLPNDACVRQAYYQLATTRVFPSNDVKIKSTRVLIIDEGVTLSPTWHDIVAKNALLEVVRAPMRYNPKATANEIKRIISSHLPRLNLSGNSVLLDTIDYNGLWTTAFDDAVIERAPFYNLQGEFIGAVGIMRVQRRARMVYHKQMQVKIIELPVSLDERYRMLFGMIIGNNVLQLAVDTVNEDNWTEVIAGLRYSRVPIDIAIPRMMISSDIDVRVILKDLGINELWTDPAVTRFLSDPPALPSSFVQRATVVLNSTGLEHAPPASESADSSDTGLDPILGRDLFGLFDAETYSFLISGGFTQPTYLSR